MPSPSLRYRIGTRRRALARKRAERRWASLYGQFVRRGDLCFDVGAHVGDRTAVLLGLGARVVAVEPQQLCLGKLQRRFADEPRVVLVEEALGPAPGEAELRWPQDGRGLASLSSDWIDRVRESGRFDGEWTSTETVTMTTLDALIERFGAPSFCKIDVEGFEYEILCGLSEALAALSLEFTPEHLDATARSFDRLNELGRYEFNFALGETPALVERRWLPADELIAKLRANDRSPVGDVYARLAS
jgi:FkbM family methyltransferase